MKLSEIKSTVETFGNIESSDCVIGDPTIIFDILRNKLYSNIIAAICREISCNARDAHREAGKQDVPIEIHLPNNMSSNIVFKDYGPGISPERADTVYRKYGISTKRDSNLQTGAWGLGSKTPWGYTDTFLITTVVNNIKYSYSAVIDETKAGKLLKLSEVPTDEANFTEITVPVKSSDFTKFKDEVEKATRHWDVKPIIKGGTLNYSKIKTVIAKDDWFIANLVEPDRYNYQTNRYENAYSLKLIIDKIEYSIEFEKLKAFAKTDFIQSLSGNLYINFNNGDLTLSASRENVYLDKPTEAKIAAKIEQVSKSINDIIQERIDQFNDLYEANVFYYDKIKELFNSYYNKHQFYWKGCALSKDRNVYISGCQHISNFERYQSNICKNTTSQLIFSKNTELYYNDLGIKILNAKHVAKPFEDANLEHVQVISFENDAYYKIANDKYHFDKMNIKLLSTITKGPKKVKISTEPKLIIYKLNLDLITVTPFDSIKEDKAKNKVLFLSRKSEYMRNRLALVNKSTIETYAVNSFKKIYPDHSFYFIDESIPKERIEKDLPGFISGEKFIEDLKSNSSFDQFKIKNAKENRIYGTNSKFDVISELVTDKNCTYIKYHTLQEELNKLYNKTIYLQQFVNISDKDYLNWLKNNPDQDFAKLKDAYQKKYPLLNYINPYHDTTKEIAQYINLINKEYP